MHSVDGTIIIASREELFTFYGTGHDVANQRIAFRQVCSEVHLLPFEPLTYT